MEEEPAIQKANLNNNEINKVMGQRWKIADKQVRLKYEEMSRKDKLRYVGCSISRLDCDLSLSLSHPSIAACLHDV